MNPRTDLAVESFDISSSAPNGVTVDKRTKNGVKITAVTVSDKSASEQLNKPCGEYITLEMGDFKTISDDFKAQTQAAADELTRLLPKSGTILAAGLGNSDITPDSIGPIAASMIFATRHIPENLADSIGLGRIRPVAAVSPGVLGQTGIEAAEMLKSLCDSIRPAAVIVIDALAAASISRLGNTLQLTNAGIVPGSGVQNARAEISRSTLGVPVVAIGIPTVVDLNCVINELTGTDSEGKTAQNMMITPREIDVIAERAAKTAAFAVNRALFSELDFETLEAIIA